ncbi:DUF6046 domain-containing protein [uncultured Alistipes sp.]|uniref:DUF6046 domain-containing protein n=1 Tax=uncultured Alistipes sp. TaxID=538949 RepID=UPI0025A9464D|nr:DUF6046 domain-containing protein [uncultured Alistipes sp.]
MAKASFDLDRLAPRADAGWSGSPFDPAAIAPGRASGRFGAIPPFFISPQREVITRVNDIGEIMDGYNAAGVVRSVMPMRVRRPGDREWFTLPLEPLVSVSGKNTIVRRKAAKSKTGGTVKEQWGQDDYEVTIRGVVSGADESKYPESQLRRLLELFGERQAVEAEQEMLRLFGIYYLAIESASFPHTKGMNNQHYEIKAYSDSPEDLLIMI